MLIGNSIHLLPWECFLVVGRCRSGGVPGSGAWDGLDPVDAVPGVDHRHARRARLQRRHGADGERLQFADAQLRPQQVDVQGDRQASRTGIGVQRPDPVPAEAVIGEHSEERLRAPELATEPVSASPARFATKNHGAIVP